MENLSHSHHHHHHHHNMVSKKPLYSNGATATKALYDDVFGGPSRFGAATTLSPRVEDYNEIFSGFHASSRAASIPVLDLPVVHDDQEELFFDVRSSLGFDYGQVFGGYGNDPDFALSFEELMMMESNGACHGSSSDEAWTPADAEYLSEESDHSASNRSHSVDSHESIDGCMEFNISYHKASQSTNEDMINGVTGVTQLLAVPGYSCMVDNTTCFSKTDPYLEVSDDGHLDIDFTGEILTGKHFRKTVSHPCNSSVSGPLFRNEVSSARGHLRNVSFPNESFITISDLSLRTQPSHLPPPSRLPPPLDVNMKYSGRSTPHSNSISSEGMSGDSSPPYFDVEIDASSSAAASSAAIKEAMEKAHAKLKSAKELMDRKRAGFHSHIKSSSKNGQKGRNVDVTKDAHGYGRTKEEKVQNYYEGEDDIEFSVEDETLNFTKSTCSVPDSLEGKKQANMVVKSSEENYRKESFSSQDSDKVNGAGEWKYAGQFFELVQIDKSRTAFDQVSNENILVHDCLVEQGKKEKTTVEAVKQHQENVKKVKAVRADYGVEECPEKSKEACEWEENNGRSEAAKVAHRQKRVYKKVQLTQEVCGRAESDKKVRINNLAAEDGKRQTRVEGPQQQESTSEVQQAESTCNVKLTMKYKEKEGQPKANGSLVDRKGEMGHEEAYEQKDKKKLEVALEQAQNERRVKEALERKELDKRRKDFEKKQKEAHEREENERRLREALECQENERKLKEALEKEDNERRLKDALLKEDNERRQREASEKENEERLREARARQENEKRIQEALEMEENEKRIKENLEQEKMERQKDDEREENENRRRNPFQKEQSEKRIKEESMIEGEEEENGKLRETQGGDENKTELMETCEWESIGDTSQEACNMEETELRHQHYEESDRLDGLDRVKKDHTEFNATCILDDEKNLISTRLAGECECNGEKLEASMENAHVEIESNPTDMRANEKEAGAESGNVQVFRKTGESTTMAHGCFDHGQSQYLQQDTRETPCAPGSLKKVAESEPCVGHYNIEKPKGVSPTEYDIGSLGRKSAGGERGKVVMRSQVAFSQEAGNFNTTLNRGMRESTDSGRKMDPALAKGNNHKTSLRVHAGQSIERKVENLNDIHSSEEREADKVKRENQLEMERLRKMEEEMEREREREKDRMAVDRAALEARERVYGESREKAERVAVGRATAEARQRALNEARERLEKACAEAREKSPSIEARLRAERAAVERATAEARERAFEKAMADRAACEARERIERSVSEKFSASSWNSGMRPSPSSSDLQDHQPQASCPFSGSRYPYSSVNGSYNVEGVEGESAQRCKARLERHQRTAERAAKALAEKNMRDLLAQREQAERHRLAETLDADVKRWSSGKEGNLRALLSTLQYILGSDSGWHPVPLTEVITSAAVKRAYRKATLCVHPDKLQQRGATIQQKYVCEKVFDLLKEAWNRFNSEER